MSFPYFDIPIDEVISDPQRAENVRVQIQNGKVGVARNFLQEKVALDIRKYLINVGRCSLPTYHPIKFGEPNFHRLNQHDDRSHVRGCFHQFVFYPWNQDVFDFFDLFDRLFQVKNLISGNPAEKYSGRNGTDGVVSRLAFQFYPSGKGFLNRHQDPFGFHQLTVPTVCLSDKSLDFRTGGAFLEDSSGKRHFVDDHTDVGDVVFFDARLVHGVELIDEGTDIPWLDFQGRWSCLIATNKMDSTASIPDAIDLDRVRK